MKGKSFKIFYFVYHLRRDEPTGTKMAMRIFFFFFVPILSPDVNALEEEDGGGGGLFNTTRAFRSSVNNKVDPSSV